MVTDTLTHLQNRLRQLVSFNTSQLFDPISFQPIDMGELHPDVQSCIIEAKLTVHKSKPLNIKTPDGVVTQFTDVPDKYDWTYKAISDKDRTKEIMTLQRAIDQIAPTGKGGPEKVYTDEERVLQIREFLEPLGWRLVKEEVPDNDQS